jgi:hypothetical protein
MSSSPSLRRVIRAAKSLGRRPILAAATVALDEFLDGGSVLWMSVPLRLYEGPPPPDAFMADHARALA